MTSKKARLGIIIGLIIIQAIFICIIIKKIAPSKNRFSGPDIQGSWKGTLKGPTSDISVSFNIFKTNGLCIIIVDSPEQALSGYHLTSFSYVYPSFRADVDRLGGGYQATLNNDITEMSGTWKTALITENLLLKRELFTTEQGSLATNDTDLMMQSNSVLGGYWSGSLELRNLKITLNLKITEASGSKFYAELDVPEQGIKGMLATSVTFEQPTIKINFGGISGAFEGGVNDSHTAIIGTWNQLNVKVPLTFNRVHPEVETKLEAKDSYSFTNKNELQGHWHGTLAIFDKELPVIINISESSGGTFTASFDDSEESLLGVPATSFNYDPPNVHAVWPSLQGDFRAKLHDGKISGVWQFQGTTMIPLNLERN